MKRVLVLGGGGAKGISHLAALKVVEQKTGRRICDMFDLIYGTSIGSIAGTLAASGELSMSEAFNVVYDTMQDVFHKRPFSMFRRAKYDRKPVRDAFSRFIPVETPLSAMKTKLAITSVSAVDKSTHFFKSWEKKDGQLRAIDAVERSYAAPVYFGPVFDKDNAQVWLDGGTGGENLPVDFALRETWRLGWKDEPTYFLVLGTGFYHEQSNYAALVQSYSKLSQILTFMDPLDGGLSRYQQQEVQTGLLRDWCEASGPMTIMQYLNKSISEQADAMDNVSKMPEYEQMGYEFGDAVMINMLK